jgi:carboxyl-terminal processing protease
MRKSYLIALVATILLAVGLAIYFHQTQPPDQGQTRERPQIQDIVGVGFLLRMNPSTHAVFIQEVVPGSPAANAGITTGLVVNKVDEVSLAGKRLVECVNLVRGPAGSTVQLELINPDLGQTNTFKLTRQKINLPK